MFLTETKELKDSDLGQPHSRLHVWQSPSDGIPGGARRKGYKRIKYECGDIFTKGKAKPLEIESLAILLCYRKIN